MTVNELNRDIKRLAKAIEKKSIASNDNNISQREYTEYITGEAHREFMRLYRADTTFASMNKTSVLIMLRLNLRHRFMQLHTFGIDIPLEDLI